MGQWLGHMLEGARGPGVCTAGGVQGSQSGVGNMGRIWSRGARNPKRLTASVVLIVKCKGMQGLDGVGGFDVVRGVRPLLVCQCGRPPLALAPLTAELKYQWDGSWPPHASTIYRPEASVTALQQATLYSVYRVLVAVDVLESRHWHLASENR